MLKPLPKLTLKTPQKPSESEDSSEEDEEEEEQEEVEKSKSPAKEQEEAEAFATRSVSVQEVVDNPANLEDGGWNGPPSGLVRVPGPKWSTPS